MEEKEFNTTFAIPANYTDSGKIFGGMLEPRNAVEALILILIVGYPELMLIPILCHTSFYILLRDTIIPAEEYSKTIFGQLLDPLIRSQPGKHLLTRTIIQLDNKTIRSYIIIKIFHRTGEQQMPVINHLDVITDRLYFRQNMSGQQHGMFLRNFPNQIPNIHNLIGIQTIRRFIQHHETRVMHDSLCNPDPLLVPPG